MPMRHKHVRHGQCLCFCAAWHGSSITNFSNRHWHGIINHHSFRIRSWVSFRIPHRTGLTSIPPALSPALSLPVIISSLPFLFSSALPHSFSLLHTSSLPHLFSFSLFSSLLSNANKYLLDKTNILGRQVDRLFGGGGQGFWREEIGQDSWPLEGQGEGRGRVGWA